MAALAIAHRAGNSLAGLHAANVLGADVIECDVHEHRGRLEVRHLKTAGPLPFLWDRWELASASAPRLGLAELLDADEHGTTFMLDIKGRRSSAARSVARLLHQRGHHRPVLVCGRWWPSVETVAADLPFVQHGALCSQPVRARTAAPSVSPSRAARQVHGVSVHRSLLDARDGRRAERAGRGRDDLAGERPDVAGRDAGHRGDRDHQRRARRAPELKSRGQHSG